MEMKRAELLRAVRAAPTLVVYVGAGASAESGLPPARFGAYALLTGAAGAWWLGPFLRSPLWWMAAPWALWPRADRLFRRPMLRAEPNAFHRALAALASAHGKNVRVITQNMDGLELRAGLAPEKVAQLHGTVWRTRCSGCAAVLSDLTPRPLAEAEMDVAPCAACSGWPQPDVVLAGQPCLEEEVAKAQDLAHVEWGDVTVLAVGMRGTVPTCWRLICESWAGGRARFIDVNPEPTRLVGLGPRVAEPCAVVFAWLMEQMDQSADGPDGGLENVQ